MRLFYALTLYPIIMPVSSCSQAIGELPRIHGREY